MSEIKRDYGLIGRKREIDRILAIAAKVNEEKRPISVLIEGKAGIGRTAIINFAGAQIAGLEPSFYVLGSVGYRGIPTLFFPIDHLVMEMLRFKTSMLKRSEEEIYSMIMARLAEMGIMKNDSESDRHAKILTALIATAVQKDADLDEEMTTPVEKYLYSVRRILSLMSDQKTLVLTLDDLHQYTGESLGLVRALRTGLINKPILWLLATESANDDIKRLANEVIDLPPLSREDTATFLRESFTDLDPFPEELINVLYSTSGGVPGLLNHHISLLIDNRILELGDGGRWVFKPDRLVPEYLPIERGAIIDLRLNQLDDSEKEVLVLAAAIGEVFWDDAILALKRAGRALLASENPAVIWPDDSEILSEQMILDRLCQMNFIARLESQEFYGVAEYGFVYEGLREKLQGSLDARKRKLYSRAAARWLEMVSGHRRGEYGEVIARHLEQAGDRQAAAHHYIEAAKVAKARYLYERAFDLYRRSLESMEEKEALLALESLHEMGNMAQALAKMDVALDSFNRMLHIAWKCVSRSKAAAALSKIGRIHRQQGDNRAARAFLERSLALFTQAGDVRGIASTKDDLGTISFLMGSYEQAMGLYNEALAQRIEMSDTRGVALSYEHIGQIARATGNYEEAEKHCQQALELRRKINDEEGLTSALNLMGIIAYERGSNEAAISIWKEALEHAVKTSNLKMMEYLNNNIGELFMELGQNNVAESHFKQSMEIATMLSDRRCEAEVCKNLGLLYTKAGNVKAARDYLDRSITTARETGSREQMGLALRALGQLEGFSIFDEGGQAGAAESYFQEALDIFRSIANESEFLRTMEIYGKYLFDHGRVDEAITIMEKALVETTIKSEEIRNRFLETIRRMRQFAAS